MLQNAAISIKTCPNESVCAFYAQLDWSLTSNYWPNRCQCTSMPSERFDWLYMINNRFITSKCIYRIQLNSSPLFLTAFPLEISSFILNVVNLAIFFVLHCCDGSVFIIATRTKQYWMRPVEKHRSAPIRWEHVLQLLYTAIVYGFIQMDSYILPNKVKAKFRNKV